MKVIFFIIKASLTENPYKRTVVVMGKDEDLHNLLSFTVSIYLAIRDRACYFCLALLYKDVTCDLKDKVLSNIIHSNFSSELSAITSLSICIDRLVFFILLKTSGGIYLHLISCYFPRTI